MNKNAEKILTKETVKELGLEKDYLNINNFDKYTYI